MGNGDNKQLNESGLWLRAQLLTRAQAKKDDYTGRVINVAGVGGLVSAAYEQLRNAAEYSQDHLLIQNALRRFYNRNLSFTHQSSIKKSLAEELVIELTQAGYLKNNTQPIEVTEKIRKAIKKHYKNYWALLQIGIDDKQAKNWTLDLLTIESENILNRYDVQALFLQFAYSHYLSALNQEEFKSSDYGDFGYEVCLYIAVHRTLLKSDIAAVRYDLQRVFGTEEIDLAKYAQFHKNLDATFVSPTTNKIVRYINKYGAPLRVFKSLIQENDTLGEILIDRDAFERAYMTQVTKEYERSKAKLTRGLVKSLVFLFVTKIIVGLALEVPYDLMTAGAILYLPLIVNLLTPVAYLSLLRLGIKAPGKVNAKALQVYAGDMLYGSQDRANLYPTIKDRKYPFGFKIAYALLYLSVFSLAIYVLSLLGFNIIQGIVFFIFLAAASFLGFRLSKIVQELELVVSKPPTIIRLMDMFFTPFTFLGKWLSENYQKVNIVALILDTFIELPLKTALRLARQWTRFLEEKKESI